MQRFPLISLSVSNKSNVVIDMRKDAKNYKFKTQIVMKSKYPVKDVVIHQGTSSNLKLIRFLEQHSGITDTDKH